MKELRAGKGPYNTLFSFFLFLVWFFVRGVLLWALYTNNCFTAIVSTCNIFRSQVVSCAGFKIKNILKIRSLKFHSSTKGCLFEETLEIENTLGIVV